MSRFCGTVSGVMKPGESRQFCPVGAAGTPGGSAINASAAEPRRLTNLKTFLDLNQRRAEGGTMAYTFDPAALLPEAGLTLGAGKSLTVENRVYFAAVGSEICLLIEPV